MDSSHKAPKETPEETPATPVVAPTPLAHPVTPHHAAAQTAAPVATGSKALAITALVLAIVSVVIGIIWFVAAPIAIVAIVLSIIALAKHASGKGQSIAALVVGGVSLIFLVPFWALISLVALAGIQQAAEEYRVDAEYQSEVETKSQSELFN